MHNETETESNKEQRVNCFFASLNIQNNKYSRLYSNNSGNPFYHRFNNYKSLMTLSPDTENFELTNHLLATFKHMSKKPQEKLVHMHFLKDSNFVVLGYDKQADRGDINFIAVN